MPEVTDLSESSLIVDDPESLPNSRVKVRKIHFYGRDFKGRYSVRRMINDLQEGRESAGLYKEIDDLDIMGVSWLLSRVRPFLLESLGLGDIKIYADLEPEKVFLWEDDHPVFKIVTKEEILRASIGALELSQRAMRRYLSYGLLPAIGVTFIPNKVFFEPLYEKLAKKEEIYQLAAKYSYPYADFEDVKAEIVASMKEDLPGTSEVGYLIKAIDDVFPADIPEEEVPQWVWEWRALLLDVEVDSFLNAEKKMLEQE
ncbi:MAG: hypothetical protein HN365_01850 [Candidatus Pacebacteria bacterium]|nr:hypothetical protein [Candidatus Paceibacterota bacterium]